MVGDAIVCTKFQAEERPMLEEASCFGTLMCCQLKPKKFDYVAAAGAAGAEDGMKTLLLEYGLLLCHLNGAYLETQEVG